MAFRSRKRRRVAPKTLDAKMKILSRKVTKIARMTKPEVKADYIAAKTITPNSSGEIEQLSLVAQGSSQSERTGLEIRAHEIHIRGKWFSSTANSVCRMIVYYDTRQGIDSKSTVAEVLEEVNPFSAMNQARDKRYKVLMDRFFSLNDDVAPSGPIFKTINWKKKLDFPIAYNGTLATDGEKNQIWMLTITDQPTAVAGFRFSVLFSYLNA